MDETEEEDPPISLSRHLFEEFRLLVDPAVSAAAKVKQCEERWIPNLQDPADAYVTFSGDVHQAHLPSIPNWNSSFRKAYTLLFWIRPRLGDQQPEQQQEHEQHQSSSPSAAEKNPDPTSHRRLLYRFSTDHNDANGTGVCVTCSPWRVIETEERSGSDRTNRKTYLKTTLTAFALPYSNPAKVGGFLRGGGSSSTAFSSWTQQTLVLEENKWHLVGCTHQYPYLKRPVWNVTVDGALSHGNDGTNELHYPVLNEGRRAQNRHMTDCMIFHNLTAGGAQKVDAAATSSVSDDAKPASQLQDESERKTGPIFALHVDLASFSLYNEYVPPNIQAILAEAGPALTQQQQHATLPPVPNWTKGCSMTSGPKVGIPLSVHGLALEVQRLASSLYFSATAVQCRVLGQSLETRLSCPHVRRIGRTESTPRVGLVQPQPVSDDGVMDDDDPSALYITGTCSLTDILFNYLLHHGPENLEITTQQQSTKHWSVAWSEQPALQCIIMPFFLALSPPDAKWMKLSCQHLYQLYHGDQKLAVSLIRLLAACIETGGARVHEQVLQDGVLHILASSLRLGLIRAHKLRMQQHDTMESFLSSVSALDELPSTSTLGNVSVPNSIAEAVVKLLDVTCGPDADVLEHLPPSQQIRRTSDLALTAVFCLGLDWDLWANGSMAPIEGICRKYGGTCVTSGFVLRSQISVQHLLDRMRSLKREAPELRWILLSMMLSSLTNQRSITQGEKDVAACVAALTESSLGTMSADIVFSALVDILVWCEVLPNYPDDKAIAVGPHEDVKVQVASKLGRNLMLSQFHDVVAPVLLSRTVFSGDSSPTSQDWQLHWQKCLLVFSWLASIAGPEGVIAAQSTGSLMLASSLAGSLPRAMNGFDADLASTLFLPSPSMALWIGATFRNEWSYKDLLADRLHIMMPMLPSLVVSMLDDKESHVILSKILMAVKEALERVFGGIMHSAGRRPAKQASGSADTIKAARSYVPHLLAITMVLENKLPPLQDCPIPIYKAPDSVLPRDKMVETESWVSSSSTQELSGNTEIEWSDDTSVFLRSCQDHVLRVACGLMVHAMSIGGDGVALSLLKNVVTVLKDPSYYKAPDKKTDEEDSEWRDPNAKNILARTITSLLWMCLKREEHWQVWGYELSTAVSKLCQVIEELALTSHAVNHDVVNLLAVLLHVLAYGRDASGWCQLALPTMKIEKEITSNSRALLPILRPSLRIILRCLERLAPSLQVQVGGIQDVSRVAENFLDRVLLELDASLTAAIVGLSFADSRDIALNALAALRAANVKHPYVATRKLLVKVTDELGARYQTERRLRNTALFNAYEDESASETAASGALAVEKLMLGTSGLFGGSRKSGLPTMDQPTIDDDFVVFHSAIGSDIDSKLGFDELRGLGAALDGVAKLDRTGDHIFDDASATLSPFLDAWDKQREKRNSVNEISNIFNSRLKISEDHPSQLPIVGAGAAADAMSTFFEFAAIEKNRMKEITVRYLPMFRSSKHAFAGRFCWSSFSEIFPIVASEGWERSVPDGNRDVRSKLATVPCIPQFSRYLPRYLDNSYQKPTQTASKTAIASPASQSETDTSTCLTPEQMGELTKTLLETGNLEIIDITKKEMSDEEPDLLETPENIDSLENEANGYGDDSDGIPGRTGIPPSRQQANEDAMETSEESEERIVDDIVGKGHFGFTTSPFSTPPDNSSSSLGLMQSAASGLIEQHVPNCTHVKAEGNRQCTLLLTASHLILEYDGNPEGLFENEELALQEEADRQRRIAEDTGNPKDDDPEAALQKQDEKRHRDNALGRPKSIRWNLSEVSHIYLRRYRLRESALELFVIPTGGNTFGGFGIMSANTSLFLDFGPGRIGKIRRDDAAFALMRRAPPQAIKQWPDKSEQFLHEQLSRLTLGWAEGRISNFDYLLHLNILSGRSYNDICQYPVFPWVLADYTSTDIPSLSDPNNFRDLTKPVGALNPDRLADFLERFRTFADPAIPAFMYGSHYSTSAGVVLHFLVRLHPFAGLHRQLQSGHFDVADRLFSSVPRTWSMCTGSSAAEVKELTPEWYCNPAFLRNVNNFKLGTSQDGEVLGDVALPPWAEKSPEKFVEVMRAALESDICSQSLPDWIDLIFGRKQQGQEAIKANNVFFYLTYYGTVDVASIEDEALRVATELQIAHFGQCPMQLFRRPHVRKVPRLPRQLTLYQVLSSHNQKRTSITSNGDATDPSSSNRAQLHSIFGDPIFLPFFSAPMSHWMHSSPPPPGPHTALIAVRFAGADRCIAVDQKGIFHYFRWAWRADEGPQDFDENHFFDNGCFVAQRELPRFKTVPRLMFAPLQGDISAVAISKTLFANRSLLLVLSDGDGCGSLGLQLVDPIKGDIKGQVVVSQVHSSRLTCIATDPIGTAAGHGGVGGELALVGSADGNASLWRFMSSQYLPMRPRVHLRGHGGEPLVAVALCSSVNLAATLSPTLCCLYSTGNGALTRSFGPPIDTLSSANGEDSVSNKTKFAQTSALALSVQGYVATVCETTLSSQSTSERTVYTLHLFTTEGVSLGSKPLESWRGIPKKMYCTPDGTTLMVCNGRGVTMHRLSVYQPLEFLDEFQISDVDDIDASAAPAAWDVDLGPALNRPVVAAAGCSAGALRLHALPGISAWSERYRTTTITKSVGSVLSTPAKKLTNAVRESFGFGQRIAGVGREIKREVESEVRERNVGGFLGNVVFGKGGY